MNQNASNEMKKGNRCPYCGKTVSDGQDFCIFCGKKIAKEDGTVPEYNFESETRDYSLDSLLAFLFVIPGLLLSLCYMQEDLERARALRVGARASLIFSIFLMILGAIIGAVFLI